VVLRKAQEIQEGEVANSRLGCIGLQQPREQVIT
jgi:hypothetical protein